MAEDLRDRRRRQYLRLGVGELAATAAIVAATSAVSARLADPDDGTALWAAVGPLIVILVQASGYWLAARAWVGNTPMPGALAALYRAFRALDVVVLGAGLVGVLVWWPASPAVALLAVAVWLFAVAEYVNYFVVRLAYPAREWFSSVRRWRTPQLVRDIAPR